MSPDTLAGYELGERIAVGGMAEIFRARRTGPGGFAKPVAIKRVLPDLARNPEFVRMFLEEARLAAQLSSPGLVQVFDFGEERGAYFLVMEYVEGVDLAALLAAVGPLSEPIALHLGARLCQTLGDLHEAKHAAGQSLGIVHRDVSPSNVLVSVDGDVKLADLGVAKARVRGLRTEPGAIKGKLAYLSPEQVRGEDVDARADLYALGLVIFEALTGESYLRGDGDAALLRVAEHPVFRPPSQLRPSVARDVDQVLRRVLSVEPEQRYPSAAIFQKALAGCASMPEPGVARRQLGGLVRNCRAQTGSAAASPVSSDEATGEARKPRPPEGAAARSGTEVIAPAVPRRRVAGGALGAVLALAAAGAGFVALRQGWPRPAARTEESRSAPAPSARETSPDPGKAVSGQTADLAEAPAASAGQRSPPTEGRGEAAPEHRVHRRAESLTATDVPKSVSGQLRPVSLEPPGATADAPAPEQPKPTAPRANAGREVLDSIDRALAQKGVLRADAPELYAVRESLGAAVSRGELPAQDLQTLADKVQRVAVDRAFIDSKLERLSRKVQALPEDVQQQLRGHSQEALSCSVTGRYEEANRHLNAIAAVVEP